MNLTNTIIAVIIPGLPTCLRAERMCVTLHTCMCVEIEHLFLVEEMVVEAFHGVTSGVGRGVGHRASGVGDQACLGGGLRTPYLYVCMYECMYVCMYVCMYFFLCVHIKIFVQIYIYK